MNEPIVLGTSAEETAYYQSLGKDNPNDTNADDQKEPVNVPQRTANIIDIDNLEPLSDEELKALRNVHLRHASDVVYMQSDIEFYDFFYKGGEELDPLTKAAHLIKRVYMKADEYFHALDIRDAYIDMVIECDFGGNEHLFNKAAKNGSVYVPPEPYYSKRAKDYGIVSKGIRFDTLNNDDINEESTIEWIDAAIENSGIDPKDIKIKDDIITEYWLLNELDKLNPSGGLRNQSGHLIMSVADLSAVQQTLTAMYQNRQAEEKNGGRLFSRTAKRMREDHWRSLHVDLGDTFSRILQGDDLEEKEDPNGMVHDPVMNKAMTRREYKRRELIRNLSKLGWNEYPLMKLFNIGSSYERRMMLKDDSKKRKLKRAAKNMMNQMGIDTSIPDNPFGDHGEVPFDYDPMEELLRFTEREDD